MKKFSSYFCQITFLLFFFLLFSRTIFAMSSGSYQIDADSINFGGRDDGTSTSYQLHDTGGETATGDSSSASYEMRAGYRAMVEDYRMALSCTDTVTMGPIVGTGQSDLATNESVCTVKTDNPAGYSLVFSANSDYLINQNSDQINPYTPVSSGTPEYWNIDLISSEWGARLKSTSTSYDTVKWGAASSSEEYANADVYWHNVTNSGSFTVITRNTETAGLGDNEVIQFGAEVGSNKFQPTGTYNSEVTITAVSF